METITDKCEYQYPPGKLYVKEASEYCIGEVKLIADKKLCQYHAHWEILSNSSGVDQLFVFDRENMVITSSGEVVCRIEGNCNKSLYNGFLIEKCLNGYLLAFNGSRIPEVYRQILFHFDNTKDCIRNNDYKLRRIALNLRKILEIGRGYHNPNFKHLEKLIDE